MANWNQVAENIVQLYKKMGGMEMVVTLLNHSYVKKVRQYVSYIHILSRVGS